MAAPMAEISSSPEVSVQRAIEIMQEERGGYVVLVKGKKAVGIFTETDVTRKVLDMESDWDKPVSQFMTKDLITISPNDSVGKAISLN